VSRVRAPTLALAAGAVGGLAASLCVIIWALVASPPVGRGGEAFGLLAALLLAQAGVRASGRLAPAFSDRLLAAAVLALTEGVVVGAGAYLLFARLRPSLLAERYAAYEHAARTTLAPTARSGAELLRLAAAKAQYLDPGFQALSTGGLVCFFALLLGAYGAFRAQAARRYRLPPAAD
jgi:hypothetical protein